MKNKTSKLLQNTFLFLIGNIGSKFIQFFLVPLYTYTMTVAEFGTADLILTGVNILMPIFSIQLSDALLRFGLDKKIKQEDTINVCLKILFVMSLISLIMFPILNKINGIKNMYFYFIIILNLRIYRDILSIILKIKDKNKIFSIDSILYTFVLCVSSVILLSVLKRGISGYLASYVIANVVSIIFIIKNIDISKNVLKNKVDHKLLKDIIIYSLPMIINSISYWITMVSDRFMIKFFLDITCVGLYAVATKIPTIIATFTGIFNQAWMISSINEYENERDVNFYSSVFEFYRGISFIACSAMICIIKIFMKFYVSADYFIAWKYSTLLILSAVFSGICAFVNGIFYAYKKNITATLTTLTGAIANIILNFLLIPKYGIMGACVSTVISWILIMLVRLMELRKILNIKIRLNKILICSTMCLIQILNLIFINTLLVYILNFSLFIITCLIEKSTIEAVLKLIYNKLKKIRNYIRQKTREKYDFKNRKRLTNKEFTIISSNCIGGVIYHNLNQKFYSPTINLYFNASDFIKFCKEFEMYIDYEPILIDDSKGYPIVELKDIIIYAIHYNSFEEFKEKWIERIKRINKNNIYIIMSERDGCEYSDLLEFDKLKFKNKVVFTHKQYPEISSSVYIKGIENKKNDKERHKIIPLTDFKNRISGFRYIDDFDYVSWLNK